MKANRIVSLLSRQSASRWLWHHGRREPGVLCLLPLGGLCLSSCAATSIDLHDMGRYWSTRDTAGVLEYERREPDGTVVILRWDGEGIASTSITAQADALAIVLGAAVRAALAAAREAP